MHVDSQSSLPPSRVLLVLRPPTLANRIIAGNGPSEHNGERKTSLNRDPRLELRVVIETRPVVITTGRCYRPTLLWTGQWLKQVLPPIKQLAIRRSQGRGARQLIRRVQELLNTSSAVLRRSVDISATSA